MTKQFGQIVTYRNIKKWQDEALTLFSGDGDPNEYLLEEFSEEEREKLVVALEKLMQRAQTAAQESLKGR